MNFECTQGFPSITCEERYEGRVLDDLSVLVQPAVRVEGVGVRPVLGVPQGGAHVGDDAGVFRYGVPRQGHII